MRHVLLFMKRKVLSDALCRLAETETHIKFFTETNPENILFVIPSYKIEIIVVEVGESGIEPAQDSLNLCCIIRENMPDCKLILLCPENSKESKRLIISAKKEGRIDDFIFYDTSVDYLISKLLSMK